MNNVLSHIFYFLSETEGGTTSLAEVGWGVRSLRLTEMALQILGEEADLRTQQISR